MSETAIAARKAMKEKAHRLASGDPHARVDASSWTPPEALNADVQTGERPVSRRQYKKGGKVEGEVAKHHAGHKPRKSGGKALTADSYVNRDVREANEDRDGTKHVGGFKKGGRAHRADGGSNVPTERFAFGIGPSLMSKALKTGGKAKHGDEKEDEHLVREMVKKDALTGRPKRKAGGSVSDGELEGTRPEAGGRMARKKGGRAKDKMNVNIIIGSGAHDQSTLPMAGPPPGGAPMPIARPPMPPQAAPQGMPGAGAPPGAGIPPNMMPRKSGGRATKMMEDGLGAGGGLGRLKKIEAYG